MPVIVKNCIKCKKEFELFRIGKEYKKERKFCSYKCSNSRDHNEETKKKISDTLLNKEISTKTGEIKTCCYCNKEYYRVKSKSSYSKFCNKSCQTRYYNSSGRSRKAGLLSVQSQNRRSKNEVYFSELCSKLFDVKNNEAIFNGWDADIVVESIKYAILWNGVWHYKKISKNHSLKQVQNRDAIKTEEILKCGYTPYVIKDMGKYNKNFVENEFEKFVDHLRSFSLVT